MGIRTVAVRSDADREALFVREADDVVPLGPGPARATYLNAEAIVAAALASGADAIHPGYGFLSEDAEFARRCVDAGLIFVGPPPEVIRLLGSKLEARRLAERAAIAVLPSFVVTDATRGQLATAAAERIGLPLMVKASAGGGGRGMRLVRTPDQVLEAVASAEREAGAAFTNNTVFLEPYIESARHVEVQIFGDVFGNVIDLYERECTVQRRHQKVIEEAPCPSIDEVTRAAIRDAAVRLARIAGYVNAGTVEFVIGAEGRFWFLEVNTRLQVEHPVTEAICGLDLVQLQLEVAMDRPLPARPSRAGHAIEARLCAEDPEAGYLPTAGILHEFAIGEDGSVRVDSGVQTGSSVGVDYDSLLAKVIAHAPSRGEAIGRLTRALRSARVHGLRTNRDLLVRILEHPRFAAAELTTDFLGTEPGLTRALADTGVESVHALAAAMAAQAERRALAPVLRSLPSGWRNVHAMPQHAEFGCGDRRISVDYERTANGLSIRVSGQQDSSLSVADIGSDVVVVAAERVPHTCLVQRAGDRFFVDSDLGASEMILLERFPAAARPAAPGSLTSPTPGVVVRIPVSAGEKVTRDQVLVVIEAMKTEFSIVAPASGVIREVRVALGETVQLGTAVVVLDVGE